MFCRSVFGACLPVLVAEYLGAEREYGVFQIPFLVFVQALLGQIEQSLAQGLVGRYFVYERIRRARQQRVGFELYVEIQLYAEFANETADNALKELVDCKHRETAVIVQNTGSGRQCAAPYLGFVPARVGFERVEELAFRPRRQSVYLAQNTRLHLFGGLVGKGHCKNPPVLHRVFHDAAHVFV